jgi:hypothetical protein
MMITLQLTDSNMGYPRGVRYSLQDWVAYFVTF